MDTKNIYRLFLLVLLVAAVGGGIWYCYRAYESQRTPEDGTLVEAEFELHNEA